MKQLALITWASSGLGKEFAYIHAEHGGDMILVARREEKLQELKKQIESEYSVLVHIISKDLTKSGACQEVYDEVLKHGEIKYLINNAWFWGIWKFYERSWEQDKSMIDLNITALTELTRVFLPHMVDKNSWKILNISSTASLLPGPNQAVYYATKAYVTSFSNAIAEELYDTDITVTALLPGATETEFWAKSGMDKTSLFSKTASARDVALDGYNAMLEGKLNIISGMNFWQKLLMKIIPLLPKKMVLKMVREGQEVK